MSDYCKADASWHMAVLRYVRAAGADESGLLGEKAPTQTGLFAALQQAASGQIKQIAVLGNDYPTKDGTVVRDFTHVSDIADGHIAALDFLRKEEGPDAAEQNGRSAKKPRGEQYHVFNLGTGEGVTVMQVLEAYGRACAKPIPHEVKPRRPEDVESLVLDVSKANRLLGWKSTRSLDQICADSWRWANRLGERPKVLCTGGCGYVGSHTAVELLREGYDVTLLDVCPLSVGNKIKARIEEISGHSCKFVSCNMQDREAMDRLFFDGQFEAVVHFAAFKSPSESTTAPWKYYYNNVLATLNLLETMGKYQVKRFVFSSSATVYALSDKPIREDFPLGPINPYGESKRMTG